VQTNDYLKTSLAKQQPVYGLRGTPHVEYNSDILHGEDDWEQSTWKPFYDWGSDDEAAVFAEGVANPDVDDFIDWGSDDETAAFVEGVADSDVVADANDAIAGELSYCLLSRLSANYI
jgi:hypothetical protein